DVVAGPVGVRRLVLERSGQVRLGVEAEGESGVRLARAVRLLAGQRHRGAQDGDQCGRGEHHGEPLVRLPHPVLSSRRSDNLSDITTGLRLRLTSYAVCTTPPTVAE